MDVRRIQSSKRMSQIVIHGDVIYLAGQIADDAGASITVQTRQALEKIDRLLAEAGSNRAKILSATVWLADYKDFGSMNEVWDEWVPEHNAPSRACVESKLMLTGLAVEISVIAAK